MRARTVGMVVLVLTCFAVLPSAVAAATTRTVCPSGCDFPRIQPAILASAPGDTITVSPGSYVEEVVVSVTGLTILGGNDGIPAGVAPGSRGPESTIVGNVTTPRGIRSAATARRRSSTPWSSGPGWTPAPASRRSRAAVSNSTATPCEDSGSASCSTGRRRGRVGHQQPRQPVHPGRDHGNGRCPRGSVHRGQRRRRWRRGRHGWHLDRAVRVHVARKPRARCWSRRPPDSTAGEGLEGVLVEGNDVLNNGVGVAAEDLGGLFAGNRVRLNNITGKRCRPDEQRRRAVGRDMQLVGRVERAKRCGHRKRRQRPRQRDVQALADERRARGGLQRRRRPVDRERLQARRVADVRLPQPAAVHPLREHWQG